jgi:D-aspartate ligase
MNRFKIPAIVFGGGITGLGIARNLGKNGIDVNFVVEGIDAVFFSKFCKKKILIPNFREREDLVRRFLKGVSRNNSTRAVIFAADDASTLLLSNIQSEIKDDYHFVLPCSKIAEELIVKRKFYESLTKNEVPHPKVVLPSSINEVISAGKQINYPIFIKPSISPYFHKVFHRKGFIANSLNELAKYYDLAIKRNIDVIFQEIIPGPDSYVYGISGYFNRESRPAALFAYHRLRGWPNVFGTSSLIESVAISNYSHLKEIITRYLSKVSYFGIMEAEFKLDPRDHTFKLIEINARSWWQNSLPTKCGLNIILKAYLDAIGEETEYSEKYAVGVKWINFLNDLRSSIFSVEITKKDWICSFKKVRDWALFDIHDPFPAAVNLLKEVKELLG